MSIYSNLLEQYGEDKFRSIIRESINDVVNEKADDKNYYDKFNEYMNKKYYDIARYYLNKITDAAKKKEAIDKFNKARKASKPYNESQLLSIIKKSIDKLNSGDKLYKYLINYRNKHSDYIKLSDDYIKEISLIFEYEKIKSDTNNNHGYYIEVTYAPDKIDQDMRFAITDYIEPTIRNNIMNSKQFVSLNFGDGNEGSFAFYDENYDQEKWYE